MTSKAAKLRMKRIARGAGRPRKKDVERYPGGQIKHAETERDVLSVAVEARKRIHGIDTDGKDAHSGYTLGRIYIDGSITKEQLEAGNEFAQDMMRYYSLVGIPFPSARAQSLFSVKGHEGDISQTQADRARRATNRMMELLGLLLRLRDGPQVRQTVMNVCVMDIDHMRHMPPQQMLYLRRGLQELHEHKVLRQGLKSANDISTSALAG